MANDQDEPIFSAEESKPSPLIPIIAGLCYFVLFFGAQYVASFLMSIVYGVQKSLEDAENGIVTSPQELSEYLTATLTANANLLVIFYTVLLMLVLFLLFSIRRKNFFREIHLKKLPQGSLPAVLILPVGLALLINSVLNLLPAAWINDYAESSASLLGMSAFWIALLSNAVCAPLSEEFTFRGLMLTRFNQTLPKWAGILLTSLIFGLVHGQILWICYAALLGIVFGFVAEYEGTILASLILHSIFNLIGTCISYLDLPGSPMIFISAGVIGFVITAFGFYLLLRKRKAAETA